MDPRHNDDSGEEVAANDDGGVGESGSNKSKSPLRDDGEHQPLVPGMTIHASVCIDMKPNALKTSYFYLVTLIFTILL